MKVRLLDIASLDPERVQAWQDLAGAAEEPNPFLEPAAVRPAAALLPGGGDVELLVVEDGGELLFALPVQRRQRYRRVPVPALVAWDHPYCFLGTPLVRRGRALEAWVEVLDHFRYRAGLEGWAALPRLTLHGPVAAALEQALDDRRDRASTLDRFGRPVLLRRADGSYLDDRISPRHLKTLRRQRRRLEDALGDEVCVVDQARDPAGLPAAVEGLLALELTGWKGSAGTAMACRAEHAEYFRRFCAGFAGQGRLQLWSLGSGARAAAYQSHVVAGSTVFHVKVAYDDALRAQSPGLQLELAMVEEFHRDVSLSRIDSCGDADIRVSAQLYPDRDAVGSLLVPLRGRVGAAAATLTPPVLTAARTARSRLRSLAPSPTVLKEQP